jgi:hypothetical protein
MKTYNYEYFCGANVYVSFNGGRIQSDVAGISYEVIDSSTPIYGYSSRLFDAVAPGQKLIRGSFVLNFRSYKQFTADILSSKLNVASGGKTYGKIAGAPDDITGVGGYQKAYEYFSQEITKEFESEKDGKKTGRIDPNKESEYHDYLGRIAYSGMYNGYDGLSLAESLHEDYNFEDMPLVKTLHKSYSALDATMMGPFNINISFGGSNNFELVSCYINNFGSTIQISEEVILQEFSFFGRNIIHG